MIRKIEIADIEDVVEIHLQAFPGFFLTFLGPAFLRELYTAIMDDPTGIALLFEDQHQIVGFVAGTEEPAGFYHRLIQTTWWRFALSSLLPALKQPSIIPRLLRAFTKSGEAEQWGEGVGLLMSISVHPKFQGAGFGKTLVNAFLKEARERGLQKVTLTTDKQNNDAVNAFYAKLGFTCTKSYTTPEGREMNEYQIAL